MEVSGPSRHDRKGSDPLRRRQLNHVLHLRRKAEIQNLGNVDDTARAGCMGLGLDFVTDPSAYVGNHGTTLSQAALGSLLPGFPSATLDSCPGCIDTRLGARPQPSGLYVYVKTKLGELIRRPSGRD